MARKTARKLKDGAIVLPPEAEAHLAKLAECPRHPASEDEYQRFLVACRTVEEHWVRVNAIQVADRDDPKWAAFEEATRRLDAAQRSALGACDMWRHTEKKAKEEDIRRADPTQSNVEMKTAHLLVSEEFPDAAGELQWKTNGGLAAYKLVEAMYEFVIREEDQEVPLCPACQ
jgi:hypothetical protein